MRSIFKCSAGCSIENSWELSLVGGFSLWSRAAQVQFLVLSSFLACGTSRGKVAGLQLLLAAC